MVLIVFFLYCLECPEFVTATAAQTAGRRDKTRLKHNRTDSNIQFLASFYFRNPVLSVVDFPEPEVQTFKFWREVIAFSLYKHHLFH